MANNNMQDQPHSMWWPKNPFLYFSTLLLCLRMPSRPAKQWPKNTKLEFVVVAVVYYAKAEKKETETEN